MQTKPKKKGHPPIIEIDKKQFEGLCAIACTLSECEAALQVSGDTIERWCLRTYNKTFAEVLREKRKIGNVSLRRAQHRLAVEKLNPTMLIFLGKNRLGQRDKYEMDANQNIITQSAEVELETKLGELIESFSKRRNKGY